MELLHRRNLFRTSIQNISREQTQAITPFNTEFNLIDEIKNIYLKFRNAEAIEL